MLPLYIFCAVLGIPLLAMFALGGNDADAEFDLGAGGDVGMDVDVGGFDADVDGGGLSGSDFGVGDLTGLFRRIPVSSYAFFMAFFGGAGIAGTVLDVGFIATIILAVSLGLIAAFTNTAAFSFLRNTDSDSTLSDRQIEGRVATVSVPIEAGKRGRVWIDTGDERVQITAGSADGIDVQSFGRGEQVVIISMANGVAEVMPIDPELSAGEF